MDAIVCVNYIAKAGLKGNNDKGNAFLSGPLSSKMTGDFGLALWFYSGHTLPVHAWSLTWMRAGRAAITC